ncbi:MAG: ATP-binding protein, partial [Hominilimicola sp.]
TSTDLNNGKEAVLYISKALGSVSGTIGILRIQLVWVTVASLLLGFIIAYFISRRFARPVLLLSEKAAHMADRDFKSDFKKGFCSELDELSDTLNKTADDLAKAENFRREFFANISHDLRTPLTMIKGYAEMVRDFSWESEETRETDLNVIIREADRLTGLVNEILEYSAFQSGHMQIDFDDINISSVAQKVIGQFAPMCVRNSICIETEIEANLIVCGSEENITRVIYNLIDNAITHSGNSKKIQITVKGLPETVRTEVRDFGSGIEKELLPHVWDRYFTMKQQKRNETGSGLGLAISREILISHGADFGVESEIGEGSTFWFELKRSSL